MLYAHQLVYCCLANYLKFLPLLAISMFVEWRALSLPLLVAVAAIIYTFYPSIHPFITASSRPDYARIRRIAQSMYNDSFVCAHAASVNATTACLLAALRAETDAFWPPLPAAANYSFQHRLMWNRFPRQPVGPYVTPLGADFLRARRHAEMKRLNVANRTALWLPAWGMDTLFYASAMSFCGRGVNDFGNLKTSCFFFPPLFDKCEYALAVHRYVAAFNATAPSLPRTYAWSEPEQRAAAAAEVLAAAPRNSAASFVQKDCWGSGGSAIRFLLNITDATQLPAPPPSFKGVLQRYIPDPLLFLRRKFHLRLYTLVTSYAPLRLYFYSAMGVLRAGAAFNASDFYTQATNERVRTEYERKRLREEAETQGRPRGDAALGARRPLPSSSNSSATLPLDPSQIDYDEFHHFNAETLFAMLEAEGVVSDAQRFYTHTFPQLRRDVVKFICTYGLLRPTPSHTDNLEEASESDSDRQPITAFEANAWCRARPAPTASRPAIGCVDFFALDLLLDTSLHAHVMEMQSLPEIHVRPKGALKDRYGLQSHMMVDLLTLSEFIIAPISVKMERYPHFCAELAEFVGSRCGSCQHRQRAVWCELEGLRDCNSPVAEMLMELSLTSRATRRATAQQSRSRTALRWYPLATEIAYEPQRATAGSGSGGGSAGLFASGFQLAYPRGSRDVGVCDFCLNAARNVSQATPPPAAAAGRSGSECDALCQRGRLDQDYFDFLLWKEGK